MKKDEENQLNNQIDSLIESRKLLHFLINEQELKNTPILLICNVREEGGGWREKGGIHILKFFQNEVSFSGKSYTEDDLIVEVKGLLKWNDIGNPKNILCLKLGKYSVDYETVWRNATQLISKK